MPASASWPERWMTTRSRQAVPVSPLNCGGRCCASTPLRCSADTLDDHEVAAGGARQSAQLWRSMLRIDCAALLGPGSRRVTRCIRYAHYARTDAASQIFRCALRAPTPDAALLAAT